MNSAKLLWITAVVPGLAVLLATAGSTVDGRTIDARDLEQIAASYDPKTYGARVNIEHIRGISGAALTKLSGFSFQPGSRSVSVPFTPR